MSLNGYQVVKLLMVPISGIVLALIASKWRGRSPVLWGFMGALGSGAALVIGITALYFMEDKRPLGLGPHESDSGIG